MCTSELIQIEFGISFRTIFRSFCNSPRLYLNLKSKFSGTYKRMTDRITLPVSIA